MRYEWDKKASLDTKPHGIDRTGSKEITGKSMKLKYEVLLENTFNIKHIRIWHNETFYFKAKIFWSFRLLRWTFKI